jgi:hypothetical protein
MHPDSRQQNAARTGLFRLQERFFPEQKALQRLFQKNLSFRSLCSDYQDCLAAWAYWQQSTAKEASELCRAYETLLQELEQEVRLYLQDETGAGSP